MNWKGITSFKHECGEVIADDVDFEDLWDDDLWVLIDLAKQGLIKHLGYHVWADNRDIVEPDEEGVIGVSIRINKNGTIIGYDEWFTDDYGLSSRLLYHWGQPL